MLIELAIGDAYGAGFEYAANRIVREQNSGVAYIRHPRHAIEPGCYTDDTQMSLAIAEALVEGDPWTPQALAARFVDAFKRDPREGYASGFHAFLCEVRDGADFLARIRPDSAKSGAAMRAPPIGVLRSLEEVVERAAVQARVTHDTPGGIGSAVAAALSVHYFVHALGAKQDLGRFLSEHVPGPWQEPRKGKVGAEGMDSVHAAVAALIAQDTMSGLLRACIAYTGDVDTVATIALAAGSCCAQIEQDLPISLYEGLENQAYGHDYLRALDRRLMALR
ncbi:ADP-ribosylglycohydrolase family protein [Lysobacter sp. BMK333-48F3]|uniref:ADP-ribosylglycohydrolase family protein n=1 Tax=Lysobacter sp. BMK333-48F3 TaxID=2867962 RepID=UPI001C8CC8E5|nr:ADP-ribosylglycohydrolase family protein [Lysobacter sp. BMK333-48F3]MBX9400843.1 ADP-ribosylglycohydrolase family protein [Lysobacter sp. BMK333-48F3]